MPQTLLALFALTLASFLAFNQQGLSLRSQQNMVTDEIELAAASLASEVVAFIEARSFDERSTPDAIHAAQEVPSVASDFSQPSAFGSADRGSAGCDLLSPALTPDCDDVDDVDGLGWVSDSLTLAHGRTLPFEIRTQVFYVADPESMVQAGGRTLHKRVVIDIRSPHVPGDETNGLVRLTRVVSYDPIKAEKDYEDPYGPLGTTPSGS